MRPPPSIRQFEALFLGSLVAWIVAQALTWDFRRRLLAPSPVLSDPALVLSLWLLTVAAVSVAVWYFAARRHALAAKWGAVALAACSLVALVLSLPGLIAAGGPSALAKAAAVLASLLCIGAAVPLFRPDAKTWFAEPGFADHERPE